MCDIFVFGGGTPGAATFNRMTLRRMIVEMTSLRRIILRGMPLRITMLSRMTLGIS
jgi:hypothetical protein